MQMRQLPIFRYAAIADYFVILQRNNTYPPHHFMASKTAQYNPDDKMRDLIDLSDIATPE